jgi:hypothetical protein
MSNKDLKDLTHGKNALRIAGIETALKKLRKAGFDSEAALLESEIDRLRELAETQHHAGDSIFREFKDKDRQLQIKKQQPSKAADIKHKQLEPYKQELREWAQKMYLDDKACREKEDKALRPKRGASNNSANVWLLGLYLEDRAFEADPTNPVPKHTSGNLHGSPQPPTHPRFKATHNFFWEAITKYM